jgi:transposase
MEDKYWDRPPLNRHAHKLERLRLSIPSSSMADQITWATRVVQPIYELLRVQVLCAGVMHVDATSIPVRDSDGPPGIHVGSLWGYVGYVDAAVYLSPATGKKLGQREGELGPEQFLAMRGGPVIANAANLFDASLLREGAESGRCSRGHPDRRISRALRHGRCGTRRGAQCVCKRDRVGANPRTRSCSRGGIRTARWNHLARRLGGASLSRQPPHRAHALPRRRHLAHRQRGRGATPLAFGHRQTHFLFAGSHASAERTAIAYSICATCARLGSNPVAYLADVLSRLAPGVSE